MTDQIIASATPANADPLALLVANFDAVSEPLCRPLTSETEAVVDRLVAEVAEVAKLDYSVPPSTEYARWLWYYRLAFEAIDLAHLRRHATTARSDKPVVFATAWGADLTLAAVKAAADRLGAEAVFFVAADDLYVEKYARWYVLSVLKNLDVPALVIVHVIGGAGRLDAIAQFVGVRDPRLIYVGDAFNAEAVETRCHASPRAPQPTRPIAHFQSVRFQRLGALLRVLNRPVFVSDIDLLLQRGVSDLLARCQTADLVLNENRGSAAAGSRLTANLLLVFPTPKALVFVDFLDSYLKDMLSRAHVHRWIDQFGLLMAYQALLRNDSEAKVQFFDTDLDINNVIYRKYQDNPFRFLSLYNGFDMESLEPHRERLTTQLVAE